MLNLKFRRNAFHALIALVALGAAEMAARVDDWIRLDIPVWHTPDYDHDLKYRDWFGIRGRPNGRYGRWKLDNYGFRGPDLPLVKAPGCVRVMAIGASETFGLYESENHEYPAQLRDSLRGHGCYEVINAGIVGAGIPALVRLWEHYLSQFRPDFVLVYISPVGYLGANARVWNPIPSKAQPEVSVPPRPRLVEQFKNVWETPDFIQRRRIERWIAADTRGRPDSWFFHSPPEERLNLFVGDLDSLTKAIRADGSSPLIITHAMTFGIPPDPADEINVLGWRRFFPRATTTALLETEIEGAKRVRTYAAHECLPLVDAQLAMNGKREYFADGQHFTDRGAGTLAGLVTQRIIALKAGDGGADSGCS